MLIEILKQSSGGSSCGSKPRRAWNLEKGTTASQIATGKERHCDREASLGASPLSICSPLSPPGPMTRQESPPTTLFRYGEHWRAPDREPPKNAAPNSATLHHRQQHNSPHHKCHTVMAGGLAHPTRYIPSLVTYATLYPLVCHVVSVLPANRDCTDKAHPKSVVVSDNRLLWSDIYMCVCMFFF